MSAFFVLSVSAAKQADKPAADGDDVKADSVVYDKPTEWRVFASGAPVKAFAIQRDMLWYASQDAVVASNLKKSEVQKFPKLGNIPGSDINCVTADQSGKIWFGGKNGIAVRNGANFTNYTTENGLPDINVNAIAAASDGSVWVGTDNGAAVFQANQWKVYNSSNGLAGDKISAIVIDKNGAVWLGSNKGISVFNGTSFTIHNMKKGLSWNDVKALAVDPKNGNIWAAVGEKDVNCFEGGTWKVFMEIQPDISSIMVDSHSRVWFGSATGIIKFNGDEWISDPKQIGVPATQVFQMYRESNGNLWFAMENGAVRLSNPYPF
jgi:ligand-binding sensor domain-containing protein